MFIHYWNMNVDTDGAADTETDMESIWIAFGIGYREHCQFFHKLVKIYRNALPLSALSLSSQNYAKFIFILIKCTLYVYVKTGFLKCMYASNINYVNSSLFYMFYM